MADTNSPKRSRVTLNSLSRKKTQRTRITAIGVYDAPMAAIADRVGFDLLIVGYRDDCLAGTYPPDEQSVHIDPAQWQRFNDRT